ncbi:hypothetical protein AYO22_04378 [Fonsecaea multimorphosa]|nr:hypothetical protein AYO22_04378 [Fonsecaea multimorphosa]
MHEHFAGVDHFSPTRGVDFALNHYGKAMREVVRLNQAQLDQNFDCALVTCALFSAFESLQGQYHEACNHAASGIRILAEEQQSPSAIANNQTHTIPREDLTRFFVAMERQILELGDPNFPGPRPKFYHTKPPSPMPHQFTSHEHALLHIEFLMAELFEYAARADLLASEGPITGDVARSLLKEFHAIKTQCERWQEAFDAFSSVDSNEYSKETPDSSSSTASSPTNDHSRPRSPAFLILRAYRALMIVLLARIETDDEAALNDYTPQFWKALDAVEEFIQSTSILVSPVDSRSSAQPPSNPTHTSSTSPSNMTSALHPLSVPQQSLVVRPTFSLALGIVPALFLIASRTFDLPLRDKALSLLRMCNRREGLWDSRLATSVVDRVIELREQASNMSSSHPLVDAEIQRATTTSPEAHMTDNSPASGQGGGGGGNAVEFRILDIKFLPGRRCMIRYAFADKQGRIEGMPIPMLSGEAPSHVPGASAHFVRDFWEEVRWEG